VVGKCSGSAMIEVEQSTQALGFVNRPDLATGARVGAGYDIGEPLMIAFVDLAGGPDE
jgi:hypothetical protein